MGYKSIVELKAIFARHGISTLYIKHLAPNQDNEKNQIYLGSGRDGVLNLFPGKPLTRIASRSARKRSSDVGRAKVELKIQLSWLDATGAEFEAPNARIIDYFQYPELRLSGFMAGCGNPPDPLRRSRQNRYGERILVLGVRPDGRILGCVLTRKTDPVVRSFPELPELPGARIFRVMAVRAAAGKKPRDLLCAELRRVVHGGWHLSQILGSGARVPKPFRGAQGAGYTLEALLGVRANAIKGPDFQGYEIKTIGGSRISLMTPSPDGGYQGKHPFREFMKRYGTLGSKKDGSKRFTGLYRCGEQNKKNKMGLNLRGYNAKLDQFEKARKISVELVEHGSGTVVASWSLDRLISSWNEKHASIVYIKYERRAAKKAEHDFEYRYAGSALIGEGTDIWRLLRAIHRGLVFYDPAHSIYSDGSAKVRPQWRINTSGLKTAMAELYSETTEINL